MYCICITSPHFLIFLYTKQLRVKIKYLKDSVWTTKVLYITHVKGVVYDSNPKQFCQIQRISPHSPLAFRSVCALKKKSGVHTQHWLCKRETNRATNPGHQMRTR